MSNGSGYLKPKDLNPKLSIAERNQVIATKTNLDEKSTLRKEVLDYVV